MRSIVLIRVIRIFFAIFFAVVLTAPEIAGARSSSDFDSSEQGNQPVMADAKPSRLTELRKNYSNTFRFKGPDTMKIALTFDDVPDPRFTGQILKVLRNHKVKATFFVVGAKAKKFPKLLQQIHQEGHVIGNHSFNHPRFKRRSVKQVGEEILRTEKVIHQIVGYRPKFIRPPYGEITEPQVQWMKRHGYTIVNWNVDSEDWKGLHSSEIKRNVLQAAGPGAIILHHAGGGYGSDLRGTINALPDIIQTLKGKGYQFVDLSELLQTQKYR